MISVIIPSFNAEKTISACLSALLDQTFSPSEYEIIVVDDGSTDGTSDAVMEFNDVKLVRQKNRGPAAARNTGVERAAGDLVLFTDSDCIPERNWIEQMVRPFENDPGLAGAKGAYKTRQREYAARFVQLEYEDKYDLLGKSKYIDFIDTYSAAFRRGVFLELGGYDTSFPVACAEDVDLSFRMHSRGYRMVFNPDAVVYHTHPASFAAYFKKKYKFAYWRMLAVRKSPEKAVRDSHTPQVMKLQLLLLPAFAGSLFVSFILPSLVWLVPGVLAVFLCTTVPFSLKAFRKDRAVGLMSPLILSLRSVFQFFGVFNGAVREIFLGGGKK